MRKKPDVSNKSIDQAIIDQWDLDCIQLRKATQFLFKEWERMSPSIARSKEIKEFEEFMTGSAVIQEGEMYEYDKVIIIFALVRQRFQMREDPNRATSMEEIETYLKIWKEKMCLQAANKALPPTRHWSPELKLDKNGNDGRENWNYENSNTLKDLSGGSRGKK